MKNKASKGEGNEERGETSAGSRGVDGGGGGSTKRSDEQGF